MCGPLDLRQSPPGACLTRSSNSGSRGFPCRDRSPAIPSAMTSATRASDSCRTSPTAQNGGRRENGLTPTSARPRSVRSRPAARCASTPLSPGSTSISPSEGWQRLARSIRPWRRCAPPPHPSWRQGHSGPPRRWSRNNSPPPSAIAMPPWLPRWRAPARNSPAGLAIRRRRPSANRQTTPSIRPRYGPGSTSSLCSRPTTPWAGRRTQTSIWPRPTSAPTGASSWPGSIATQGSATW